MLIRTEHVEEHRLRKYQQNNTAVHPSNPHWILHQSHNKSAEDSIKNQTESGRMGNVRVVMTGGLEFSYRTLLSNFKLLIHFIGIGNETKWPCEDTKRAETANVYWACFWRRITRRIRRRISQFANVNMAATTPSSSFPNKHQKNFLKKKRKERRITKENFTFESISWQHFNVAIDRCLMRIKPRIQVEMNSVQPLLRVNKKNSSNKSSQLISNSRIK